MDRALIEHLKAHPDAMMTMHDLANRYGQSIVAALLPDEAGEPPGTAIVRYAGEGGDVIALVRADGTLVER